MFNLSDTLDRIQRLNDNDKKTKVERGLKLMEECGELAEAILSSEKVIGCEYKEKTDQDVLEESIDVIIMALSTFCAHGADVENLEQHFETLLNQKLNKWKEKTSVPLYCKDGICQVNNKPCVMIGECSNCLVYTDTLTLK